jgi:hypothetical protein
MRRTIFGVARRLAFLSPTNSRASGRSGNPGNCQESQLAPKFALDDPAAFNADSIASEIFLAQIAIRGDASASQTERDEL